MYMYKLWYTCISMYHVHVHWSLYFQYDKYMQSLCLQCTDIHLFFEVSLLFESCCQLSSCAKFHYQVHFLWRDFRTSILHCTHGVGQSWNKTHTQQHIHRTCATHWSRSLVTPLEMYCIHAMISLVTPWNVWHTCDDQPCNLKCMVTHVMISPIPTRSVGWGSVFSLLVSLKPPPVEWCEGDPISSIPPLLWTIAECYDFLAVICLQRRIG